MQVRLTQLKLLGEQVESLSYIDRLNLLEKLGILPSAKVWQEMRELRNHMIHEYPDKLEIIAEHLNQAHFMMKQLLPYWQDLKSHIEIMLAKPGIK
ncbi:MAG: hypothetical protein K0M45_07965 [Candidatus Paracaedibacteraceae bacterium]|nr:hypothetical protein [Candidatus Paracaedibacteraceae bacterium]